MHRFLRAAALAVAAFFLPAIPATAQTVIISETDSWDFLHPTNGVDPAVADPDFNSTWISFLADYNGPVFTSGKPGPYSYGDNGGIDYFANTGTLIGTGGTATAPASGSRFSAYFKKQFTTTQDSADASLVLLVDDGAVIYVDGVERKRVNMTGTVANNPNGTGDSYKMLADGASSELALRPPISLGILPAGNHTIAISVHNALATSSDLGLWVRLYSEPPPPPMLKTTFGAVSTDVLAAAGTTGWVSALPYAFSLNGVAGTHTVQSEPVNLQSVGDAYFAMELYCFEVSGASNFEPEDELSAKLVFTLDDDSQMEVSLIPDELDLDLNGKLSGDEFNPGLLPATDTVVVGRQLRAAIPANAKSAVLRITVTEDSASTSETFKFGGAMISDVPLDTDEDGDGINRAAELFGGTDPASKASHLSISNVVFGLDTVENSYSFDTTFSVIAGKRYAFEDSTDGGASWTYLGTVTATGTGNFTLGVLLGLTPPERYFARVRCIP